MKKTLLLLTAILLFAAQSSNAQTISNNGFESWHNYNVMTSAGIKSLQAPNNWWGLDSFMCAVSLFGSIAGIDVTPAKQVFETSDVHGGSKAALLKTAYLGAEIGFVPGAVFNAKANIDIMALMSNPDLENLLSSVSFSGGTPLLGRKLEAVNAWVKYTEETSDKGMAFATAFQKGQTSTGADTLIAIGMGMLDVDNAVIGEYFEITVPVTYNDENNTATDTVIIGFLSTSTPTDSTGAFLVDDVTLTSSEGTTSITEPALASTGMVVYPNPSTDIMYFNLHASLNAADYSLVITNIMGSVMSKEYLHQTINAKQVTNWARGIYCYSLVNTKTAQIIKGQFVLK